MAYVATFSLEVCTSLRSDRTPETLRSHNRSLGHAWIRDLGNAPYSGGPSRLNPRVEYGQEVDKPHSTCNSFQIISMPGTKLMRL